jgi:hypothetical protein
MLVLPDRAILFRDLRCELVAEAYTFGSDALYARDAIGQFRC